MEELVVHVLTQYGYLLYPFITAWTFVEGETVVIVTGVLASEGRFRIHVEMLALAALTGSFFGDQLYYYIGRRYGTPLLKRWPSLSGRIDWAFETVNRSPAVFILSFRWIYGVRNVAPFIVGIAGVPRVKYLVLNFIAAAIWAHSFAWGGFFMGRKLEEWLGDSKWFVLGGFIVFMIGFGVFGAMRGRAKSAPKAAEPSEPT
ncbi:DedA family protein [Paramagnetospirillum magnetotacticum MS-1]|uniref:DedA family protein n=1 Tax=Paramagnetospirillum magnetotacticum MS-1 TaxID=272627 RepID=A0A0C2UA11_PARME|nr:DedA family protein [Paramagnetospirillum magnetotacticum]KIL98322.1 DedA family protein [Paramagnetospirillum magnetotacticum MS-1]